jgi:hypothetical protein
MLKTIADVSPKLVTFISVPLPTTARYPGGGRSHHNRRQQDIVGPVSRNIVGNPCPKAAADTFREAPWEADEIRISLRGFLVQSAFDIAEAGDAPRAVFLSLDDSLTDKDNGSHRL